MYQEIIKEMKAPGRLACKWLEMLCAYYDGDRAGCVIFHVQACPFNGECKGRYGPRSYTEWDKKLTELAKKGVTDVPTVAEQD